MKITKAVNLIKKITLVLTSALIYFLIFNLNKILFDTYEFSYGVNWIFIPSGFQLVLVLVAVGEGALGIVLASFIIGLENYYLDSVIRTFITALISGLAPLLSRIGAAATVVDAFLFVGSLTAQILMVLEKYESWIIWVVVDIAGTALYFNQGYYFTSFLYGIFTLIALQGWRHWYADQRSTPRPI